jgi:hypothetical protein
MIVPKAFAFAATLLLAPTLALATSETSNRVPPFADSQGLLLVKNKKTYTKPHVRSMYQKGYNHGGAMLAPNPCRGIEQPSYCRSDHQTK